MGYSFRATKHADKHVVGGIDPLVDPITVTAHHATHEPGGSDLLDLYPLRLDCISETDLTTGNDLRYALTYNNATAKVGTWTHTIAAAAYLDGYVESTVNLNSIEWENMWFPPGTYEARLYGYDGPNYGIHKLYVDGVLFGTADMYGAGESDYTAVFGSAALDGYHDLVMAIDGKNGGSSGYKARMSAITFRRTS